MFYSTFRQTRLQLLSTLVNHVLLYCQTDQTPAPLHPGKPCFTLLSDWPDSSSSPPWKTMFYSTVRLTRLQLLSTLVNHVLLYLRLTRLPLLSTLVNHVLLYFLTDQTPTPLHPGKPCFTLLSDWPDSSSSPPWLTMFYSTVRLTMDVCLFFQYLYHFDVNILAFPKMRVRTWARYYIFKTC